MSTTMTPEDLAPTLERAQRDRPLGGPFRGFGTVFVWGLRRTFSGKRAWIGILLAAGIGALIGASTGRGLGVSDPVGKVWRSIDRTLLPVVAPVIALLMVAQGFASEVRGGTLLYHLVRPVPRHVVFLARFASGWVAGLVSAAALVVGTALTATSSIPLDVWLQLFAVVVFMVTALGALYYVLSTLMRRGLIWGLMYTFLIELLLGRMPGSIQKASVNHHARGIFHGWCDDWFIENSAYVKSRLAMEDAVARFNPFRGVEYDPPATAMLVLFSIAVGLLLFGIWRIRRRDFPLKD